MFFTPSQDLWFTATVSWFPFNVVKYEDLWILFYSFCHIIYQVLAQTGKQLGCSDWILIDVWDVWARVTFISKEFHIILHFLPLVFFFFSALTDHPDQIRTKPNKRTWFSLQTGLNIFDSSFSLFSLLLFGCDWSVCQVWWGIMALERVYVSVMWLQQMAQLSIREGTPAVCSPASCFTAIKYHQGRAEEWEERSEGGGKRGSRWSYETGSFQ